MTIYTNLTSSFGSFYGANPLETKLNFSKVFDCFNPYHHKALKGLSNHYQEKLYKGLNYFDDLFDAFGFYEVEEPQEHDVILFNVMCEIPNHCGVYVGEDIFLHHAVDRLSCRESIHTLWGRYITRYARCKKLS